MKISTKGRYAIAIMLDLAMNNPEEYISLKDIATRQEISIKYLEKIIIILFSLITKELISIGSKTPLDNSFLLYPAI